MTDFTIDIPDELLFWLEAEATRLNSTVNQVILDILETRYLFSGDYHANPPDLSDFPIAASGKR
jgi:hypothetical protein